MTDQKKEPTEVKSMTLYFHSGREETIVMEKYLFKFDAAGLFINEPVKATGVIATPNQKYRIKKFIPLTNVDLIDFEYYEE